MKDCNLKLASAPETELSEMLSVYSEVRLLDGRPAGVRNSYLPAHHIQTGIGDVEVQVPKVRDRSGSGIHFSSHLCGIQGHMYGYVR